MQLLKVTGWGIIVTIGAPEWLVYFCLVYCLETLSIKHSKHLVLVLSNSGQLLRSKCLCKKELPIVNTG